MKYNIIKSLNLKIALLNKIKDGESLTVFESKLLESLLKNRDLKTISR